MGTNQGDNTCAPWFSFCGHIIVGGRTMLVRTDHILVDRDKRQRKELGDVNDLVDSIRRLGLINPIVVEKLTEGTDGKHYRLVAGERRLEAHKQLEYSEIAVTLREDLSSTQLFLLELDENIKRKDISWEDQAEAILRYHEIIGGTIEGAADAVGLAHQWVYRCVKVARELRKGNSKIKAASGIKAAADILDRQDDRAVEAEMADLNADTLEQEPDLPEILTIPGEAPTPAQSIATTVIKPPVQCKDFLKWTAEYKGRPFNFIHCDFPYGINHDKSEQGKAEQWGGYKDTPDHYWSLCKALADAKEKLLFNSGHVMFWFSMNYYHPTVELFTQAGFMVQPFPLVWHKTDGKGIVPDFKRGPRRVYETALLMSWGDRKILDVVDNTYGCPTSKTFHLSEKPEPMLKHFFRMFVDGFTEILDPTAGSGNALIAAARLGAKRCIGLEIDQRMADVANVHYRQERTKDLAAETIKQGEAK